MQYSAAMGTLIGCLLVGNLSYAAPFIAGKTLKRIEATTTISKAISYNTTANVSTQMVGIQILKRTYNASDVNAIIKNNIDLTIVNTGSNDNPDNGITAGIYSAKKGGKASVKVSSKIGDKKGTDHININVCGEQSVNGILLLGEANVNGPQMEVNGKNLTITTNSDSYYSHGIYVGNNTTKLNGKDTSKLVINAENTTINATSGVKVDPTYGDNHAIGIAAYSQGEVEINGNLTVNADTAINTRGHSNVVINKDGKGIVKLNGDINFNYDAATSGTTVDSNVDINMNNADSYLTGSIAVNGQPLPPTGKDEVNGMKMSISNGAAWNMTGDSFVNEANVKDGGSINVQENVDEFTAGKISLNNGKLNLQGEKQAVNITNLNGAGTVATNSLDNKVNVKSVADNSNITVLGSGDIADAIKSDASNAQKLADVVTTGSGDDAKSAASVIKTEEGKVAGAFSAEVDADGNVDTNTIVQAENSTNRAISDMASISLMTWRSENNDMNKRLGELRDSKGEHGAWARMARGESKYGAQNVKNQYNYYQVGYDEKLSTNPNWTVGVALSRTEGSSTFVNGSGENKHTGLAVYGSYLSESGSFVDLIAKYARMDNEYTTTIGAGSGDYETNGYSLSAEYGKRFTKDNGFWIEPQVELTYGRVGSADYVTANGVHARQDDMNSIVGRLGFSLGKDIKQGNVYVRASYLYDFDGETDVKMVDTTSGAKDAYKQDLGGGWWEVGVGTNLNLSEATHLYFDVEKTYGGNVATPWQWNAGVRWSF